MSEASNETDSSYEALLDDATIYRLARRSSVVDKENGTFLPGAFLLEPDEEGLSVFPTETCTLTYAIQKILGKCHGVNILQVGDTRTLPVEGVTLDVVRKEDPMHPGMHAEIVGLPYIEDDRIRANRAAELLANASQRVWRRGEPIPEA